MEKTEIMVGREGKTEIVVGRDEEDGNWCREGGREKTETVVGR